MLERDMMYGGYYQNMPFNTAYGNFGYQGPPGSLMPMQNNMIPMNQYPNNDMINNNYTNINTRLTNLENRVKNLEQKLNTNSYQDDNSLYII